MEDLKIIGWTSFDSDYPMAHDLQEVFNYKLQLIQKEIVENNYCFSGEEHQNSLVGMPVFSDGTAFRASMRAWGHIMANTRSMIDKTDYTYMDFYMSLDSNSILPKYIDISIKPKNLNEASFGCTIKADQELIEQSIQFGMELMTTDKVIEQIYENIKNK